MAAWIFVRFFGVVMITQISGSALLNYDGKAKIASIVKEVRLGAGLNFIKLKPEAPRVPVFYKVNTFSRAFDGSRG